MSGASRGRHRVRRRARGPIPRRSLQRTDRYDDDQTRNQLNRRRHRSGSCASASSSATSWRRCWCAARSTTTCSPRTSSPCRRCACRRTSSSRRVYVMPLGGNDTDAVIEALNRQQRFIRGEVAQAVNLKFAPDVRFRRDETFEEASRIDQLLASARCATTWTRTCERRGLSFNHGGSPPERDARMTRAQEGQSGPRLGRARQAGRHDVDAGGRRRAPAVRGAEGRPRRHARSRWRRASCRSRSARRRRPCRSPSTGRRPTASRVRFGVETDTDDAEGQVVRTSDALPVGRRYRERCSPTSSARSARCRRASRPSRSTATAPTTSPAAARRSCSSRAGSSIEDLRLVDMPDARHGRAGGRVRQGHVRARPRARHGPRARVAPRTSSRCGGRASASFDEDCRGRARRRCGRRRKRATVSSAASAPGRGGARRAPGSQRGPGRRCEPCARAGGARARARRAGPQRCGICALQRPHPALWASWRKAPSGRRGCSISAEGAACGTKQERSVKRQRRAMHAPDFCSRARPARV